MSTSPARSITDQTDVMPVASAIAAEVVSSTLTRSLAVYYAAKAFKPCEGKVGMILGSVALECVVGTAPEGPFVDLVDMLIAEARGLHAHAREDLADALERVYQVLFDVPFVDEYTIPGSFWATGLGEVCATVEQWVHGDNLMRQAHAAREFNIEPSSILRAVQRGVVRSVGIRDPRTGLMWRLVRREDVARLASTGGPDV